MGKGAVPGLVETALGVVYGRCCEGSVLLVALQYGSDQSQRDSAYVPGRVKGRRNRPWKRTLGMRVNRANHAVTFGNVCSKYFSEGRVLDFDLRSFEKHFEHSLPNVRSDLQSLSLGSVKSSSHALEKDF